MSAIDASALLAFVLGEPGADVVESHLDTAAVCSTANWSEVAQKVRAHGRDWELVRALLLDYELTVHDVTVDDAEVAAVLWQENRSLSLGDRLCLALADRLGVGAVTADRSWGTDPSIVQIR